MNDENIFKSENFTLDEFKFENGQIFKNVNVEYTTYGTPKKDSEGKIVNAVIYCHGSDGNFNSLKKICPISKLNQALDYNEYFFISFSNLGTPGSFSPSTSNLNVNFPKYTIKDMVNFQREFLKSKFGIDSILGVIGNSLGGFLAFTWATEYPESVEFVISLVSSYRTAGAGYISSKVVQKIIESDPNYLSGDSKLLERSLKLAMLSEFTCGFSREFYLNQSKEELNESLEEYGDYVVLDDVYDIKFRNDATLDYDVTTELYKISAKVLIIAINQDRYFPPKTDAIPMSKLIKNSQLVIYDSELGHVGAKEIEKVEPKIRAFLKEFI